MYVHENGYLITSSTFKIIFSITILILMGVGCGHGWNAYFDAQVPGSTPR